MFTGRQVPPSPQCRRHRRLDSEVTGIRQRCGEGLGGGLGPLLPCQLLSRPADVYSEEIPEGGDSDDPIGDATFESGKVQQVSPSSRYIGYRYAGWADFNEPEKDTDCVIFTAT